MVQEDVSKQEHLLGKLELFTSLGILNVKANEYFFESGSDWQNSRLIWSTHSAPLLTIGLNYNLHPHVSVGTSAWSTLARNHSHMVDYDWLDTSDPSHRTNLSSHSNTKFKSNGFDFHLKYWITDFNASMRFALMGGLQHIRYRWVAPSYAYYEYEAPYATEEDLYGYYGDPTKPSVSYKQTLMVPYIGFVLGFTKDKFILDANYKLGGFSTVRALDVHHERDLSWWNIPHKKPLHHSAELSVGYQYSKPVQIFFTTGISYMPKTKTDTSVRDTNEQCDDCNRIYRKKGNGLQNIAKRFSLGIRYTF